MIRSFLAAGSIAFALVAVPAVAQQAPTPGQPATQQLDPALVGQSIYSSDGQKLGKIAEVGVSQGEPVVRADLGEFLGTDSGNVIIGAGAIEKKADRIEIAMTAAEIKDTISKQRPPRK